MFTTTLWPREFNNKKLKTYFSFALKESLPCSRPVVSKLVDARVMQAICLLCSPY